MKLRLKANNPLVIKAARERSRILKELGHPVDAKTGRIAKRKPLDSPRSGPTTDMPSTPDEGVLVLSADEILKGSHGEITEVQFPVKVEPGKVVRIYSKYGGQEIKANANEFLVFSANDLLRIVQANDAATGVVIHKE